MSCVEQTPARRFINAARLHAHQTVFDEIDAADAVPATNGVERAKKINRVELTAIHGYRGAVGETNRYFFSVVGRFFGRRRQHEKVVRWRGLWLLENSALV